MEQQQQQQQQQAAMSGLGAGLVDGTTAALMAATNPLLAANAFQQQAPLLAQKTIHVGNLSPAVTVEVLRQIFGCIGTIVDVRVASDGRYGFVDFAEAEAATASLAMNGTEVCGQSIRVQRATQPRLYSNQANPPPAPMLAQLQKVPEFSAIAGVTSAAALEVLQKQAKSQAPAPAIDRAPPNFAFMNPAQQRAALEARHREMLAKSDNVNGWGVAKRREESGSEDSESDSDESRAKRRARRRDRRRDRRYRSRYEDDRGYRRRRDDYRRRSRHEEEEEDDFSTSRDRRRRDEDRRRRHRPDDDDEADRVNGKHASSTNRPRSKHDPDDDRP